jgi:hypothetical protein
MPHVSGLGFYRQRDLFGGRALTLGNARELCVQLGEEMLAAIPPESTPNFGVVALFFVQACASHMRLKVRGLQETESEFVAFVRADPCVEQIIERLLCAVSSCSAPQTMNDQETKAMEAIDLMRLHLTTVFARMSEFPRIYDVLSNVQQRMNDQVGRQRRR